MAYSHYAGGTAAFAYGGYAPGQQQFFHQAPGLPAQGLHAQFSEPSKASSAYNPKPRVYVAKEASKPKFLESSDVGGPPAATPRVSVAADITQRFSAQNLTVYRIPMDGNCLFRSFGFQMPGWGQDKHARLRQIAVEHFRENRDIFEPYLMAEVDVSFDEYCRQMEQPKTWGGEPELAALAHHFNVTAVLYDAYTSTTVTVYNEGHSPVILLCKSNGHYNAILDNTLIPVDEQIVTPHGRNVFFPDNYPRLDDGRTPHRPAFADEAPAPASDDVPLTTPGGTRVEQAFVPAEEAAQHTDLAKESLADMIALRMREWTATASELEKQQEQAEAEARHESIVKSRPKPFDVIRNSDGDASALKSPRKAAGLSIDIPVPAAKK